MMEFDDFIKAKGLLDLNIIIRNNSDIKIADALDTVRERVDRVGRENPSVDVKAELSDMRDGNKYEIYSETMMSKYDITDWYNLSLDNVSIQKVLKSYTEITPKKVFGVIELRQQEIFNYIAEHQPIGANDIADSSVFNVSQRTIESDIATLKEDGKIKFNGADKTGGYITI